jgi:hypothetical protein
MLAAGFGEEVENGDAVENGDGRWSQRFGARRRGLRLVRLDEGECGSTNGDQVWLDHRPTWLQTGFHHGKTRDKTAY